MQPANTRKRGTQMAVSEAAGVWAPTMNERGGKWVDIKEIGQDRIGVTMDGSTAYLTAEGARTLANQLRRLAKRVDARNEGKS